MPNKYEIWKCNRRTSLGTGKGRIMIEVDTEIKAYDRHSYKGLKYIMISFHGLTLEIFEDTLNNYFTFMRKMNEG